MVTKRLVRVLITPEENGVTSSPSFSLGSGTSRGHLPEYGKASPLARGPDHAVGPACVKDASAKISRGAGTSAYCQDPECLREVRRWQAARRQAKRRQDAHVNVQLAQAQKDCRQRAKVAPKTVENPEVAPGRGHAAENFFPLPLCERPGCHEPHVTSPRNPARYCCTACRQAVGKVLDRERKWPGAALWLVGRSGPLNTGPHAGTDLCVSVPPPPMRHRGHPRNDDASPVRRSSIIASLRDAVLAWASCCSTSGAQA